VTPLVVHKRSRAYAVPRPNCGKYRWSRDIAMTDDWDEVSCLRCLKSRPPTTAEKARWANKTARDLDL